jgi:hypothetical protein
MPRSYCVLESPVGTRSRRAFNRLLPNEKLTKRSAAPWAFSFIRNSIQNRGLSIPQNPPGHTLLSGALNEFESNNREAGGIHSDGIVGLIANYAEYSGSKKVGMSHKRSKAIIEFESLAFLILFLHFSVSNFSV